MRLNQIREVNMKLYQYRRFDEHTEENLVNNQLYLSKVNNANDPFEGACVYSIKDDLVKKFIMEVTKVEINNREFRLTPADRITEEHLIQGISNNNRENLFEKYGITCLSEVNDSHLMWGHYADKHNGYCLEFEFDSIIEGLNKVKYVERPYTINIHSEEDMTPAKHKEQVKEILYRKHASWKYEMEWRICDEVEKIVNYNFDCIKAVYFGFKTTPQNASKVINATKHIPSIKYFAQELKINEYKMGFKELNPTIIRNYCNDK